jgi:general secretion pathway protein G
MKITRLPSRRRRSSGFTLMELLLVLAIIGLLMGGVAVGYSSIMDNARETKAATQIGTITAYIQQYSVKKNGRVPSQAEGLRALLTANLGEESLLDKDPWGEPWEYLNPNKRSKDKFDVFSKGKDRIAGNDDDVGNWGDSSK